ncbi:MFS transporter [Acinetobacter beijerinckii]|uniref:MFS transporter n=1 Tax=Acinetobacter beijerinckii TaxID=262668 RepID=UPI0023DD9EBE|nr:MFS transporter [Acinetobacter beijerinckii]MDF2418494.1 MFS transporter [Acinetobacter beijerinckii]
MKEVALNDFIDQQKIGRYQKFILLTCLLLMVMDGYDIQAIAYAAPLIMEHWQIDNTMLGVVFSASLFGLFLGSLFLSSLADRFGRRPILLISTLAFSVLMLLTPHVTSVEQLAIIRFVTGIFLGGIMPNIMAYSSEIVPSKHRILTMMIISCGYTVGAMLGGGISALLTPIGGWHAIFYFGGAIPLVIFFIMLFKLPESLIFMANKNNDVKVLLLLQNFYPKIDFSSNIKISKNTEIKVKQSPLQLFKKNRAFFTSTIWVVSILNMISLYFLANWLPMLSTESGLSLSQALIVGSILQLGGVFGSILMGFIIGKLGFYKVLIPVFFIGFLSIAVIGYSISYPLILFMIVFISGFAIVGGQPAINAFSANYYPVLLRTTGVGWSIGIARLGSVIGPLLGGYLSKELDVTHLFIVASIPSLLLILTLLIQAKYQRKYEFKEL